MRCVRNLWPPRGGQHGLPRLARAPASRAGVARVSSPATASASSVTAPWGACRAASPRAISRRCPATAPSATCATPPRAARTSRTRSRSPSTTRAARIAVAHNGNLTNHEARARAARGARLDLPEPRATPRSIVHLIAMSKHDESRDRIAEALVAGGGRLLAPVPDRARAHRRARSARLPPALPGQARRSEGGVAHVVASEPTAFDLIGATHVRDVEPGEMLIISAAGVRSRVPFAAASRASSASSSTSTSRRPDSTLEGASVYEVRKALGRRLAEEQPVVAQARRPRRDPRARLGRCRRRSASPSRAAPRSRWG